MLHLEVGLPGDWHIGVLKVLEAEGIRIDYHRLKRWCNY